MENTSDPFDKGKGAIEEEVNEIFKQISKYEKHYELKKGEMSLEETQKLLEEVFSLFNEKGI